MSSCRKYSVALDAEVVSHCQLIDHSREVSVSECYSNFFKGLRMLKICCATIGAAACWVGPSAWGQAGAPTFAAYPVTSRYQGPGVAPRLRPGTAAWQFRTRIREAATQPPNFAGHYVLAT